MIKIAVLVGSLQNKSFNKLLAKNLEAVAPGDVEFTYVNLDLPLFNQDLETEFPAAVQAGKDIIEAADGILFVTPEYNRSVPAVLKNGIDWMSRPWGTCSFTNKPAGIVGASTSPLGTAVAQADLRHIVVYLGIKLLGQPEVYVANSHSMFDESGEATPELRESLAVYMSTLTNWIKNEE
jgi:chromate reductase